MVCLRLRKGNSDGRAAAGSASRVSYCNRLGSGSEQGHVRESMDAVVSSSEGVVSRKGSLRIRATEVNRSRVARDDSVKIVQSTDSDTKRGACRAAAGCTNEKVRCGRCENKLTDLASTSFGKPDAAVGTSRNRMRPAVAGWDGEFIDAAIDRDSSDFIARVL